jgi:hypothetical protein
MNDENPFSSFDPEYHIYEMNRRRNWESKQYKLIAKFFKQMRAINDVIICTTPKISGDDEQ